ncbi:MAG: enoyl-CoA hydratase-related protein [Candidatus Dormiibacterota bacterium]
MAHGATDPAPLLVSREGPLLILTLNRPASLNSLTTEMLLELGRALSADAREPEVRAVLLTGAGRGFCAGQNLGTGSEGIAALDPRDHLREHYLPVIEAIASLEKPVVAAVNGVAAGAGLSLALACDLRVAAESASFVQAFVRVGLVPDSGGSWFLPRLVGMGRAMEMSMLGDPVPAREALHIGLVQRVVPDSELPGAARELGLRLASGPRSVGLIKRLIRSSLYSRLDDQFDLEAEIQAEAMASDDFAEGVAAFREKRQPRFQGR